MQIGAPFLALSLWRTTFDRESVIELIAVKGSSLTLAAASTPGSASSRWYGLIVEGDSILRCFVLQRRQCNLHCQDIACVESRIYLLQLPKASDYQSRADNQHQGKCRFRITRSLCKRLLRKTSISNCVIRSSNRFNSSTILLVTSSS